MLKGLRFGFKTLRDLPDFEKLEDAGPLSKDRLLAVTFQSVSPQERPPNGMAVTRQPVSVTSQAMRRVPMLTGLHDHCFEVRT
jgi:hypothetical protein